VASFSKYLVVVLSLGFGSLASGSSEDYRSSSAAAFRLASAHSRVGDTAMACARLSQSLEHYRSARQSRKPSLLRLTRKRSSNAAMKIAAPVTK
jgi:hypothetical protein